MTSVSQQMMAVLVCGGVASVCLTQEAEVGVGVRWWSTKNEGVKRARGNSYLVLYVRS